MTKTILPLKQTPHSPYFDFVVSQRLDHAEITIQFFTNYLTTTHIPGTISLLEVMLPRIFTHKCYNDQNQSFKKEVSNTELGHLFEHILLEFLCASKYKKGQPITPLKGLTEWNWKQDPKGIFHIYLNSVGSDEELLHKSIAHTANLMNTIFLNNVVSTSLSNTTFQSKEAH